VHCPEALPPASAPVSLWTHSALERHVNLDFQLNRSHNKGICNPDDVSIQMKTDGDLTVSLRTWLIKIGVSSGLVVVLLLAQYAMATDDGPRAVPNFVVILADDLGYADVGFHGCQDIPTPRLDSLAREGVRCTHGYVSHPFCSPTRAGLLTARYQQRFGHENNPKYDPNDSVAGLPISQVTVADVLSRSGYVTGAVGKWHLGAAPCFHPLQRGFREYFGLIGGGHNYFVAGSPSETREYFIPLQRNTTPEGFEGYLTDVLTDEAIAFIRRHRQSPFFLYLAYNAPHTPLQAPESYLQRVSHIEDPMRRTYAAMVCALDDGVGRVCAVLKELGLEDETLVFFLSDNGGPVDITHASNAPFRGAKGSVYEGGIRVPFVIRWKGTLTAGRTYDQPVISLDIPATMVAAAGTAFPSEVEVDGVNLLPYLQGQRDDAPHASLFWRTGGGTSWAIRCGNWKLVKTGQQEEQLFDLQKDVSETKDVKSEHTQVAEKLRGMYEEWNRKNIAPLFESARPARSAVTRSRKAPDRNSVQAQRE